MIFGEKKIDPKASIIFLNKPLEILLIHLHGHITYEKYEICVIIQAYYTNCTREMC